MTAFATSTTLCVDQLHTPRPPFPTVVWLAEPLKKYIFSWIFKENRKENLTNQTKHNLRQCSQPAASRNTFQFLRKKRNKTKTIRHMVIDDEKRRLGQRRKINHGKKTSKKRQTIVHISDCFLDVKKGDKLEKNRFVCFLLFCFVFSPVRLGW